MALRWGSRAGQFQIRFDPCPADPVRIRFDPFEPGPLPGLARGRCRVYAQTMAGWREEERSEIKVRWFTIESIQVSLGRWVCTEGSPVTCRVPLLQLRSQFFQVQIKADPWKPRRPFEIAFVASN